MRRSWFPPVALACLLVTAGCLGFLGEASVPSPTTSPTPTGTPTPTASPTLADESSPTASPAPTGTLTPTTSPTPAAVAFPPGITESGVWSAERFANVHQETLRNNSFTIRYARVRTEKGTVRKRVTGVVRYDGNSTAYLNFTTVRFGSESTTYRHTELWSNGTMARRAVTTANGTTIEERPPLTNVPTYAGRIELYLRSFTVVVTGRSRFGGESITRVSSDKLNPPRSSKQATVHAWSSQLGFSKIQGGQFSSELAEDAVRRYRVRLVGRAGSTSTAMTEELGFGRLGSTTVDRPAWVTAANESRAGR